MTIIKADNFYHFALCVYLRTIIFIIGQDVPWKEEIIPDEDDKAVSYVGFVEDQPVATGRTRVIDGNIGKIERVGVLPQYQGKGHGKDIVLHLVSELRKNKSLSVIKLGAQDHAISFYEKFGFKVDGDGFMEAGIPHHMMIMKL